jgi:hypothetical protein
VYISGKSWKFYEVMCYKWVQPKYVIIFWYVFSSLKRGLKREKRAFIGPDYAFNGIEKAPVFKLGSLKEHQIWGINSMR